ncbi:chorismate-binding protein, partial [Bacillus cereus]|uniref:chorismate-binding protein n=1 Tax=Bacillus cereus TaxID=1396 RepID=UPI000A7A4F59
MSYMTEYKNSALQLLDDYKVGSSFFFASPNCTILTQGVFTTVKHNETENFHEIVQAALKNAKQAGNPNPIVVGALPFDRRKEVQLIVPEYSRITERLQLETTNEIKRDEKLTFEMTPVPTPEAYMNGVKQGIEKIQDGDLKKIVLSRSLDVKSSEKIDNQKLLRELAEHNKHGYTFAVNLPKDENENNKTLIGASPELLVSRSGMQVVSNPLAGSRPRSDDPAEDKRRA